MRGDLIPAGPPPTIRSCFVGRHAALLRLERALDRARAGEPQLVVVEGPAGIGKTALVNRFLTAAQVSRTLRASGDETESGLAFGVLDQLLTDVTQVGPDASGARWSDPLTAGAALLEILGEVPAADPAVLLVDDAQWADIASLQAITFALRRLRADHVLAVLVIRSLAEDGIPVGLRRVLAEDRVGIVRLDGLSVAELRELSATMGVRRLSGRAAMRLRAHTGGNPLHARALLEQLPAEALDTDLPLPAPRSFAMLVLARLAACRPDTEALVMAASALGMTAPLRTAAAVAELTDPLPALDQAVAAGLLVDGLGEPVTQFAHPLVQAAVYQHLGSARRAALHRRAADVMTDEDHRLRHLARAAVGHDSALADEFAARGRRCFADGQWLNAAEWLSEAARLTPEDPEREQYTLELLESRLIFGDIPDPEVTAARLRRFAPSVWRSCVLGHLALARGAADEAAALLRDAWAQRDGAGDRGLRARLAEHLASAYSMLMDGREAERWVDEARRLTRPQRATPMVEFVAAVGAALSGRAGAALAGMGDLPDPAVADLREACALLSRGELRLYADDVPGALRDLGGVLAARRDWGDTLRVMAAAALGRAEFRAGRWDDAIVHFELAVSVAGDANLLNMASYTHAYAAFVPAARGEWATAEAHIAALDVAGASLSHGMMLSSALARASVARARGLPEAVIASLEPLLCPGLPSAVLEPGLTFWQDAFVEAATAVGDFDRAETVLRRYEELAAAREHASAMAAAARARGTWHASRGETDLAERAYQAAFGHAARSDVPYDRSLLHLAYGQFLRRAGRRTRAAEQLVAAHDLLARLDARPDLERCDRELAACGTVVGARRPRQSALLTAQELAVARLVADGLTNAQVARQLVLSVKTVEYHLGRIFQKLRVASRAQLARRLSDTGTDPSAVPEARAPVAH